MRPVKMNKIGMLAAAMYAILEEKRSSSPLPGTVVGFEVLVDTEISTTDEYNFLGEVITGQIVINSKICPLKFKVYYDINRNLIIDVTGYKTRYTDDKVNVYLQGNAIIDFKEKSVTQSTTHVFRCSTDLSWDWKAVKATALDVIGMILGEDNS